MDHRYRLRFLPASFATLRVLDVGTFDGFYAFVAEARGAERVVAIDSEQHVEWVQARWGSAPEGGKGFRTIAYLLGSRVEYRRLEASRLDELGETFDFVFCLGILHRVTDPLGPLRLLRARLADGGRVLLETYGVNHEDGSSSYIRLHRPGDVYSGDEFVYWGFGAEALRRLAEAGFTGFQLHATPISTDTHALSHRSHSPRTTLLSQRLASDTGIIRRQTSWLVIQSRQAMRSPTTG